MAWDYKRNESAGFETDIAEGKHRIRIASAEKAVSKTGKDMLALQFEVSGCKSILYHYIVFLPEHPEITNRNLTQFFDSFKDIPDGEFNTAKWVGKVGACQVKHEEYNGSKTARVHYFIAADKQSDLPAWESASGIAAPTTSADGYVNPEPMPWDDTDVPF